MVSDKDKADKPEGQQGSEDNSVDPATIPEVEAEVVSDGENGETTSEADRDNDSEIADDATLTSEVSEDAAAGDQDAGPKVKPKAQHFLAGISPGVIVFLLFAISVAVFMGVRRLGALDTAAPVTVEDGATKAAVVVESDATEINQVETPNKPASGASDDVLAPPVAINADDKIVNDQGGSFKAPLTERDLPTDDIDVSAEETLSPSIQLDQPEPETAGQNIDAPIVFEERTDPREAIATLQREAEERAAAEDRVADLVAGPIEEDTVIDEETDDEADEGKAQKRDSSFAETSKIANDVISLKEAFLAQTETLNAALEEERRRGMRQSAEIEALREDLARALQEQGDRANAELLELRTEVENSLSGGGIPARNNAAASLALISLQRAIDTGNSYSDELKVLAGIAPDLRAIEPLQVFAITGVPTLVSLKQRFPEVALAALTASDRARATGPFSRFAANLRSLVAARPATPQAGNSSRAVISRAENALAQNHLYEAVQELEMLDSAASVMIAPWLSDARARIIAEQAINDLNALLLSELQN